MSFYKWKFSSFLVFATLQETSTVSRFFSSSRHSNRCNAITHIPFTNNLLSSSFSHRLPWRRFVRLEASRAFYLPWYSRGLRPRIENARKLRSRRIDKNLILYLSSTQEMYSRSRKYLIAYRFMCVSHINCIALLCGTTIVIMWVKFEMFPIIRTIYSQKNSTNTFARNCTCFFYADSLTIDFPQSAHPLTIFQEIFRSKHPVFQKRIRYTMHLASRAVLCLQDGSLAKRRSRVRPHSQPSRSKAWLVHCLVRLSMIVTDLERVNAGARSRVR